MYCGIMYGIYKGEELVGIVAESSPQFALELYCLGPIDPELAARPINLKEIV